MVKKNKGYFKVDRGFFEFGLRPHTAMVYLYLLSSINKDTRQCWPSMKTIARKLGISKSTVEKAIVELEQKALIIKSNRSRDSRIISNLYTLPDGIAYYHREGKDEFLYMVPTDSDEGGAAGTGGQEINKEKEMKDNYLNNQSFNKSLDEILDLAFLDGIKDKYRRDYIQSIITKMYYSEYIKVNNARIPREQIIKQLTRITPDAIEFMMKKMLENTGSMSNEVGYAIACLYNAIDGMDIDVDVDIARDFGYRGCY